MDHEIKIIGELPNLRMLMDDLSDNNQLFPLMKLEIDRPASNHHSLQNAQLASIVIDITSAILSGVVSGLVVEWIKTPILAARNRGTIQVNGLDELDTGEASSLDPPPAE